MNWKKYFVALLIINIIYITFKVYDYYRFDSRPITNCTKDESFYLTKRVLHPDKVVVKLKGKLNGMAKINGQIIGPGLIDTLFYKGDSYDNPFRIEYKNLNVTKGELKLIYKFY